MEKSNKKLGLTTKIFIALILGAICGLSLIHILNFANEVSGKDNTSVILIQKS